MIGYLLVVYVVGYAIFETIFFFFAFFAFFGYQSSLVWLGYVGLLLAIIDSEKKSMYWIEQCDSQVPIWDMIGLPSLL